MPIARPRPLPVLALLSLGALVACDQPLDYDLRGGLGAFSTTDAARGATAARPKPDDRGVITYPTYQVAVARSGDTATKVAGRLGLDAAELARFNGVGADVSLRAGEILALPTTVATPGGVDIASLAGAAIDAAPDTTPVAAAPVEASALPAAAPRVQPGPEPVRHKVERGETAYTISRLYQVPVESLAEWNGLGPDFAVREGQFLLIPVASQAPPRGAGAAAATTTTQPGAGTPTPVPPSAATALPDEKVAPAAQEDPGLSNPVGEPTRTASGEMAFPVKGKIIRAYSKGKNDGIDISAAAGTPVTAAADGTVAAITSDADQVPIIVVRHPDNLLTVYANVEKITIKKGDSVKRGQKMAALRPGDDAYVHFEVREGFDSVDPMPYLE